ncbi:hypothetical protein Amal_03477 [Acetobacter malorum]|uniref:Uncharacterized protein n=1 Tax=Acetobacter malorum TaxID=178901 RepID=A0A177G4T9_9PROT|nr:hypothetical protein [Acetobacter malorum]OAG75358.1 hypothetical protein Amal_03477 [Acetobacter malorum]
MKVSSSPFETFLTSQHETKNDLEFSKLLGNIDGNKVEKSKVKDSKHKSQHNSSDHASHAGSSTKPDTTKPDQSSSSSEASGSEEPKTDGTNSSGSGSDTSSIKSLIASAEKILAYAQTAGNVLPQVADLVDVISELKSGTISKSDATTKILQIGADILQSVGDKGGSSAGSDTSSGTSSSDSTSGSDVASSTTVNRVTPDKSMDAFASTPPTSETKRPDGDTRSAQDIINDNPILKNLGNQSGIRDKLNELVGGQMTTNPDQAYRAVALLTYIKSSLGRNGADRGDIVSDGKIDGFTKDGDARHGTEAGVLQDVTKQGWGYLGQLINHQLPDTKDSHVREDGSNMDNLPWGWQHFGEPILNILTEVAGVVPK